MPIFSTKENRIRCGRCNTEFDLSKNAERCPLCGFGKESFNKNSPEGSNQRITEKSIEVPLKDNPKKNYLAIPNHLKLAKGKVIKDDEIFNAGLWGMFNDFFSAKALLRINANLLHETLLEYISLSDLIDAAKKTISAHNLNEFKGFPNDVESESSIGRLVHHFMDGFYKMGLFEVKLNSQHEKNNIWNEDWSSVMVRPTQEGLEFAKLKNHFFDENKYDNQVLTKAERDWMISYLKKLDQQGFKEYTFLRNLFLFVKEKKPTSKEIVAWLKNNKSFVSYIKSWSGKHNNPKAFEKQLNNLAQTFSSGKISLLRELGIIKNKRNDYSIVEELK